MFQLLMASVMCLMSLSCTSRNVSKTLVEWQSYLQCRALVKLLIKLCCNAMLIDLCCARMSGHGSSSVRTFLDKSMRDNDERFADSSKTRGSMEEITLSVKDSDFS